VNRGDIVLVRQRQTPAAQARPCLIVQRSSTIDPSPKLTVCPLTTRLRGAAGQRPVVPPHSDNGLSRTSEVEVDWLYTFEKHRIGPVIGRLDDAVMRAVDAALRRWLDL
jgi:mRNA interferase MazF